MIIDLTIYMSAGMHYFKVGLIRKYAGGSNYEYKELCERAWKEETKIKDVMSYQALNLVSQICSLGDAPNTPYTF